MVSKTFSGLFITFEGGEGVGKSTQADLLKSYLEGKGVEVYLFREPGGTEIGEELRRILLDRKDRLPPLTELFLFIASRRQLVKEKIEPALKENKAVICDRFMDSTTAYQGYGCGIDIELVERLNSLVVGELSPNLTFVLDTDKPLGFKMEGKDRIEEENHYFHQKVREGYLEIARKNPERVKVISAEGTIEEIHQKIRGIVERYLLNSKYKPL